MALLFCDGFDHYDTAHLSEKWDAAISTIGNTTLVSSPGRNTGHTYNGFLSLPNGNMLLKAFPNSTTLTAGFAFNPSSRVAQEICSFGDQSVNQVAMYLTSSGQLQVKNGFNTVLGTTAAGTISAGAYAYIEWQVVFSATTGSVTLRVNGTSVLSVTNVVTVKSADAYANTLTLFGTGDGGGSAAFRYDDVYLCDANGTLNTSFLGNVCVTLAIPNGNGRFANWSRTGGTVSGNYTAVNEIPPNDNTSYVASSTVAQADSYAVSSIGTVTSIAAVQIVASARKNTSGTRVLGIGFGSSSLDYFDAGHSLSSNYGMHRWTIDGNPLTNAAWAATDFASAQIGLKVLA